MLTRAASAVLLILLIAGCARTAGDDQAGAPAPAPSSSDVVDLPLPSAKPTTEPSVGKPADSGAQTITGTVSAGVEPNCLVLEANGASHQLIFDDAAMRADAPVGKKVTLVGRSEPGMMSTCQQGVPFIVTAVRAA